MINTNNNRTLSVPQDKKIVKIIVDEKGYQNKPKNYMGAITKRMTAPENACEVDLIQLGRYITSGHAFAISYAEGGVTDNNFVSSDLVGLDFDGGKTVSEVLETLKEYNIPANIIYYTYSHGEKGERFRVITALDERITDKNEYKQIIKGYQSIFGETTDNATVGAVQRFLGTNNGLVQEIDAYSTASKQTFLELYAKKQKELEQANAEKAKQQATQIVPKASININGFDLSAEIDRYNLLDYVKQAYPTSTLKPASGGFYLNPCPLCNSNDHLHITGNKFHSFGNKNCLALGGVGIVQWLIYIENMTPAQAIAKFKYELLGIDEKQDKRAYAQAMALKEQEHNSSSAGEEQQKPSFIKPVLNKHGEQIGEKISPPLLAQHIRENLHYFFVKDDTLSDIQRYVYKNGCYRRITDDELKSYIKSYITGYNIELLKMKDVQEVFLDLITDRVFVKSDLIDADENIINFTNGILKLDTMTLEPHSPDIKSTIQIDCEWSFEDVQTPVYDSFITTLTDGDKDVQHLLEQYTGVALSNVYGYRMKKALIMVGAGDCGKSQLKQLVEKMIGSNNYCSIDLEGLEKRFGTANLHRKRLAGSSDMGFMKIDELKIFKQVVGGDAIFGEFKGKNGFNFKYKGLLWFCANRKPHFGGDKGDWVYDRMIFIDCKNVIPKEKQDKQLLEKLYAERKGIIRKCVLALKTVIQAGYNYAIPTSAIDSLDDFKKKNDSVLMFIDECVVKRPIDGFVDNCTTKIMYEVYKEWCKDNRLFAEGKYTFREAFITHFGYENSQDAIYKTNKYRYFKDYTLAPEIKDEYHTIYGYDAMPEQMK